MEIQKVLLEERRHQTCKDKQHDKKVSSLKKSHYEYSCLNFYAVARIDVVG
jgi:hypothetical protein